LAKDKSRREIRRPASNDALKAFFVTFWGLGQKVNKPQRLED
jgi:hypothetical protein